MSPHCAGLSRVVLSTTVVVFAIGLGACPKKTQHTLADGGYDRGPVIDSHTLIAPIDGSIDAALKLFERVGIIKFCNKNGGYLGSRAFAMTLQVKHRLKDQFEFFSNVRWRGVNEPGWGEREAERFEQEVRLGSKGIKIFKALGLGVLDASGSLLHVDDPRLSPLFERAGKLNAVVAVHTGDPKAFFEPPGPDNERYDELKEAPNWSFYGDEFPSREQLFTERNRVLARHPNTTFLLIHLANNPEDLDYVAKLLDTYPNVYVDTSARVPEFGRHPPDKVRAFFIRFQDRILFGSDLALSPYNIQLGSISEKPPSFDDAIEFYRRPDPGALEGQRRRLAAGGAAQALPRQRREAHLPAQGHRAGRRSLRGTTLRAEARDRSGTCSGDDDGARRDTTHGAIATPRRRSARAGISVTFDARRGRGLCSRSPRSEVPDDPASAAHAPAADLPRLPGPDPDPGERPRGDHDPRGQELRAHAGLCRLRGWLRRHRGEGLHHQLRRRGRSHRPLR